MFSQRTVRLVQLMYAREADSSKTRSGNVFSPYEAWHHLDAMNVGTNLDKWIEEALQTQATREQQGLDDAEGWPVGRSPFSSPFSSAASSPAGSRAASETPTSPSALAPCQLLTLNATEQSMSRTPPASPSSLPPRQHATSTPPSLSPNEPSTSNTPQQSMSRTRKQVGYTNRRRKRRAQDRENPSNLKIRSSLSKRHIALHAVKTKFSLRKLPIAEGAFIGVRDKIKPVHKSKQELIDEGFTVVEWDGM